MGRAAIRLIAALTVVLSVALMAVSAYAAKTEPIVLPAAEAQSGVSGAAQDDQQTPAPSVTQGAASEAATPARTAAPTRRRFAPDDAAPIGVSTTGGGNARTTVRVWAVPSLRSGSSGMSGAASDIPADQLDMSKQVAAAFGLPWQVLAAIAKVESDFGRNMSTSSAGAIGYGQFLPEEWAIYGAGGDPYDYRDALLAMARYLVAAGAGEDMAGAIHAYNHSWEYVEAVLSYASSYGYRSGSGVSGFIWPVLGPISSFFGPGHPLGIDIDQTGLLDAPVRAAHDGTVVFAGGDPCCEYGRYVVLQSSGGIATLYAHLDVIDVAQGQVVRQGAVLGRVGCTGHCTGPHLHFEVIDQGVRRDPLSYLPGGR